MYTINNSYNITLVGKRKSHTTVQWLFCETLVHSLVSLRFRVWHALTSEHVQAILLESILQ